MYNIIPKNGIILDGTIAWQSGKQNGNYVNAWGLFAKAGYRFHDLWAKPVISIRESYATGEKKRDGTICTFEPAFGASDKYYGWMNVVSWPNLDNREINMELNPINEIWVELIQPLPYPPA